jgi:uncharacterized membrane protein YecN with MAPEG domain
MRITGLYAALCAILVVALALRVVFHRFRHRIGIGDGGDKALIRLIRVHGNAIENVPLALLLLLLLELNQTVPAWLHVFGIAIVLGRVVHAFGLSRSAGASAPRFLGTVITWVAVLFMAVLLLWQFIAARMVV